MTKCFLANAMAKTANYFHIKDGQALRMANYFHIKDGQALRMARQSQDGPASPTKWRRRDDKTCALK